MKIELWAKRIDRGYVSIGARNVSDSFGHIYRIPIKNDASVMAVPMEYLKDSPVTACRVFVYTPSPFDREGNHIRKYLEQ